MLAYEGVYIIKYVTRFTEEIFAFLIAAVFLADAFKKVIKVKYFYIKKQKFFFYWLLIFYYFKDVYDRPNLHN